MTLGQTTRRRNLRSALRLVTSLRGDGVLSGRWRGTRPVFYCIDIYALGLLRSGDGDIRGDLTDLVARDPTRARLRLAGGEEINLVLRSIETEMASVELLEPTPAWLTALPPTLG